MQGILEHPYEFFRAVWCFGGWLSLWCFKITYHSKLIPHSTSSIWFVGCFWSTFNGFRQPFLFPNRFLSFSFSFCLLNGMPHVQCTQPQRFSTVFSGNVNAVWCSACLHRRWNANHLNEMIQQQQAQRVQKKNKINSFILVRKIECTLRQKRLQESVCMHAMSTCTIRTYPSTTRWKRDWGSK